MSRVIYILLDNLFTINLPAAGQKVWVHELSSKLTYDLQPIVKNKPRRAIVKGDRRSKTFSWSTPDTNSAIHFFV